LVYAHTIAGRRYTFSDLKEVLAKATPERSGDALAGLLAETQQQRMAACMVLADLPLAHFLVEHVIPY
jgi:ethanolamine ammonia-lyase large subunit